MPGIFRFINTNIPTNGCNLRCEYCYIRQHGDESVLQTGAAKERFRYSVTHMLKALSIERMGGVCMFNISGSGETLLCPEIVEITKGLLENGHYVALINNCTITQRINQMAAFPAQHRQRLFFKASFHFRELKRRNLLNTFVANINTLRQSGIAFSIEIVSSDYLLPDIDEVKAFCIAHFGALPHVLTGRDEQAVGQFPRIATKLSPEAYHKLWSSFDSDLFVYQQKAYDLPHREFCYAGVYTGTLALETGNFSPCPGTKKVTNFFEDIDSPILFAPMGESCPFPNCYCGFFLHVLAGVSREYDPGVYFSNFRDRICNDGSHWLSPTIREAFSHRCSEYHMKYSKDKAEFFRLLMQKSYQGTCPSPDELDELGRIAGTTLRSRGYEQIAIYGMGEMGRWLLAVLKAAGIHVVYAIDRRSIEITSEIPVYSPEEPIPPTDAIIVSVYYEFTQIAPILRKKTQADILSVVEVAG